MHKQTQLDLILIPYYEVYLPFYINPKDPAVNPTAIKNPNSNRP